MTPSEALWKRTTILAVAGALAFWLANFMISLTSIAAEYRAALAIAYVPMLVAALAGGVILGSGVSFVLVRFGDRIPTRSPFAKSMLLSLLALIVVTVLLEAPARFIAPTGDSWRLFLIGVLFNAGRILALGAVIGYLNARMQVRRDDAAAA